MSRNAIQVGHRKKEKMVASSLGMSLKSYRPSRWPSVGWSYAIETIRRRCKRSKLECSITPSYLAKLWTIQNGICLLTGWRMELRKIGSGLTMNTVTVDRLDPAVGYIAGNVRLVCFAANNARYIWPDADFQRLCQAVCEHKYSL